MMSAAIDSTNNPGGTDQLDSLDLSFLPPMLTKQCRSLIESYHAVHGYTCLPDMLWRSRLGPFIETQSEFRQILRKASTTRSAKKSNEGFVRIATIILSLEILASGFAGWAAIFPEAGARAQDVLRQSTHSPQMPLMDFYLYPPKHLSSAAIAALKPPANRESIETELYRSSKTALSGEKLALNYVHVIHRAPDCSLDGTAAEPLA